jgi:hypothetical protein
MARTTDPEDLKRTFQRAVAGGQAPAHGQQATGQRRPKAGRHV